MSLSFLFQVLYVILYVRNEAVGAVRIYLRDRDDRTQCIAYALQMVLAATTYGKQAVQESASVSPGEEESSKEELQDDDQC